MRPLPMRQPRPLIAGMAVQCSLCLQGRQPRRVRGGKRHVALLTGRQNLLRLNRRPRARRVSWGR